MFDDAGGGGAADPGSVGGFLDGQLVVDVEADDLVANFLGYPLSFSWSSGSVVAEWDASEGEHSAGGALGQVHPFGDVGDGHPSLVGGDDLGALGWGDGPFALRFDVADLAGFAPNFLDGGDADLVVAGVGGWGYLHGADHYGPR